jgi:K(+)-stimulated pyrophosphate-energized sodium pump
MMPSHPTADVLSFVLAVLGAIGALAWSWRTLGRLGRLPAGDRRMREVAAAIAEGARAFLARAYRAVGVFVLVLAAALLAAARLGHPQLTEASAVAFVLGAAASLASGYAGMRAATLANVRTAEAARYGLGPALQVAFSSGTVLGFTVTGLGLGGLALLVWWLARPGEAAGVESLGAFALGASSVALFARVGGGIYTKGADVGADLVGKVEQGLPEDDPRNPAVVADNVGDNVGDVAGMGADLFESYVGALVAALTIGAASGGGRPALVVPLALAALGIGSALAGAWLVGLLAGRDPAAALRRGTLLTGAVLLAGACGLLLGVYRAPRILGAVAVGLCLGLVVGAATERATGSGRPAVLAVARAAGSGPATAVIEGLALGMGSVGLPVLAVALAILAADALAGLPGIALAAVGMLAPTAMTLAVDAYGPVADNAGGIAELAGLPGEVRARTDRLDALGNTTAAVGKGIAVGSAALTALALFAAYAEEARLQAIDLLRPAVVAGCLAGAALPFLFSSVAMRAVGRTAREMVAEVRRQLRERPAILRGQARPDYARCVDISTRAALREMRVPGVAAVALPLAAGLAFGREAVAGLLAGALVSGVALAISMANAGGAMDNAKKHIEAGAEGGKGSPAHAAAVVGDTVGDPLKDTAGPALNILIKLVSIVSLVFLPLFRA